MNNDRHIQELRHFFHESFEGIIVIDDTGSVIYTNPRIHTIFALPEDTDNYIKTFIDATASRPYHTAFSIEVKQYATQIPLILHVIKSQRKEYTVLHISDETEKKEQELLQIALFHISSLTALADDMSDCYAAIHGIIGELMYAENFYLAIYNPETNLMTFEYHVDEFDPCPPPLSLDSGLTAYVIKTGEPYFYSCDKEAIQREKVSLIGHQSIDWIGVPLKIGSRVHGAMVIQSYEETVRFTDREKNLLIFVAQHIALAIERKRIEAQLKSLSLYDELTHLYNRRGFLTVASQQLKMANRHQHSMLLFFFDLDNMKIINDKHGHPAGDKALRATASVLKTIFREADILARLGGDEFVALAVGGDRSSLNILRKRIASGFETFNNSQEIPFPLEISVGVAVYDPKNAVTIEELLAAADELMYEEKKRKKGSSARGN